MPEMPVFCDKCGLIFGSGLFFENTTNVTLKGNRAQCPRCHDMANIPDGLFNFVNNTIEIIKAPQLTIDKLQRYKILIANLKENKADYDEVKSAINQNAPELASLVHLLPKTRSELYAFLVLIIATISFFLNQENDKEKVHPINVNNIINYYNLNQTNNENTLIDTNEPLETRRKFGRNDKCFCGSGFRYKECHGKN